jgi:hypothetical protein
LLELDELLELNKNIKVVDNLRNTLGIGGNGSSELIALEYFDENNFKIVLTPLIDLDKECHIVIGKSFTDFLVRLENGQEWFD